MPPSAKRIGASRGREEPVGRADDEGCEPEDPGDEACPRCQTSPKRAFRHTDAAKRARAGPDCEGRKDAERETQESQHERPRCGAISHRAISHHALALSWLLPERPVAQEDVEDGTDSRDEGDDDPHDLLQTAHLGATDDVDDAEDPGNRM